MLNIKNGVIVTLSVSTLWGCATTSSRDQPGSSPASTEATQHVLAQPVAAPAGMAMMTERKVMGYVPSGYSPPRPMPLPQQNINTQQYQDKVENPVKRVAEHPVSTFSIDVDTGSYTNARQMIWRGQNIVPEGIRAEEFINYFSYDYPKNNPNLPFSTHTLLTTAPWNKQHQLLRIALKAQDIKATDLPATNLVYLIDVSGSMASEDKLELIKTTLLEMVGQLRPQDKVSIVTYSGKEEVVLSGVSGQDKATLKTAISRLSAAGSTNGESAIKMAYQQAQNHHIKNGINRILLLTDGDFNVGVTDTKALKQMIATYQTQGIGFSTLGVGNYRFNDGLMEQLADAGNGKYSYLDSLGEARKVLIHELTSTLANVAQDVKIQVEFNPAYVQEYRLLGYDNRQLAREDFNNDKVDAGDIGAGHTVTALYEIIPVGAKATVDALRYQQESKPVTGQKNGEIAYLRLRYKLPEQSTSKLIEQPIKQNSLVEWNKAGADMYFAVAASQFAFKLQQRKDIAVMSWQDMIALARSGATEDRFGQKQEMIALMQKAELKYPDR